MRSSPEDITLLDRYIKGILNDREIPDLEDRLLTETDLKSDLNELRILAEGMRVRTLTSKLEMIRGWEDEMKGQSHMVHNFQKSTSIFSVKIILLALSLILLLIVAGWWMSRANKVEPEKLYAVFSNAQFDDNLILHSIKRAIKQDGKLSPDQQRAYQIYSLKLFDDASPLLKKLWEKQSDTLALFYYGVSELGLGHEKEGRMIFKKPEMIKYQQQIKLFDLK